MGIKNTQAPLSFTLELSRNKVKERICVHTTDFNMNFPGLEEAIVTKTAIVDGEVHIHIEMEREPHRCPCCSEWTSKVHDYRVQKVQHLKMWERPTVLFYRRRRYVCRYGKRFSEQIKLVERYQRHTLEWNQALGLRVIQGKNFTDTARQFHTSPTTVMRRFDQIAAPMLSEVKELPSVIAIDEYKGDTEKGKYQVMIADGVTGKPLDILPDRAVQTVKRYLQQKGSQVRIVVMDMSHSFKSAVDQALGKPVIVADRFHFCRYIYWALDRIRRRVQKEFHEYDRKKCKRMKHVFHKHAQDLTEKQHWYLQRYLSLSEELREAYEVKEAYRDWFETAKQVGQHDVRSVKEELHAFYQCVEASEMQEFQDVLKTFRNWEVAILNSFAYGYTNGPIEGLNNQTKVIKRNAFGFRRYDRFRFRVLLHHQFKNEHFQVG
ncbi:Transposase for insertion sequence element IS1001 [Salisediminibacterium beveridgei]|uniref:Transposase for insertion sequence element IS1001 n=2 Tax=Salisediminibacterium beveridgei TaxID=632773 RepID=A0A1D7QY07_9BACI|nr:Transposase for insertion sequence element IS1001 [Salisediminibacterium beveridgei]